VFSISSNSPLMAANLGVEAECIRTSGWSALLTEMSYYVALPLQKPGWNTSPGRVVDSQISSVLFAPLNYPLKEHGKWYYTKNHDVVCAMDHDHNQSGDHQNSQSTVHKCTMVNLYWKTLGCPTKAGEQQ